MAGYAPNMTTDEFLRSLRYHAPIADFRTRFIYNNFLYAAAGYTAEILAGQRNKKHESWSDLTRIFILDPLGMNNTHFIGESTKTGVFLNQSFARPYTWSE